MKKVILSLLVLILMTGCVSINKTSIDELINTTINSKYKLYNHVNKGYKYYLPRELVVSKSDEYNEIIKSKYYDYYLYVDLVRYYKKIDEEYSENKDIYYSRLINNEGVLGYLNIKITEDSEYIIDASYNYANIEVKVKKRDIKMAVTNVMTILSSIQYNYDVVKNLLADDKMNSIEEQVNVFEDDLTEDDYLDVVEEVYTEDEKDPDVIN